MIFRHLRDVLDSEFLLDVVIVIFVVVFQIACLILFRNAPSNYFCIGDVFNVRGRGFIASSTLVSINSVKLVFSCSIFASKLNCSSFSSILPLVMHRMKVSRSFFSTHLLQRSIAFIPSSAMPLTATCVKPVHTGVKCVAIASDAVISFVAWIDVLFTGLAVASHLDFLEI